VQPSEDVAEIASDASKRFEGTKLLSAFQERLALPIFSKPSDKSVENTLLYLFEHMRCGIFVKISGGKLAMFVPFANVSYRNTWSHKLRWDVRFSNLAEFYAAYERLYSHVDYLPDPASWWANGGVLCNVASPSVWGGHGLVPLRNMLSQLCRERRIHDCEFFVNKRDTPQLKKDATEPFDELLDSHDEPLSRHSYDQYAPICSFFTSEAFADLPFPSSDDWLIATGKVYPNEHDLFAESNYVNVPWNERKKTAFFRGSATGLGVTTETNQRLQLAALSSEWANDTRFGPGNSVDGVAFLDAGVTSWNPRSKKRFRISISSISTLPSPHMRFCFVGSANR
jgi:hypothetical protein